jgi:hypothetical protein
MSDFLIAFTGKKGSGKSTAAQILLKYGFYEEYFAKPIKQFATALGFENEQVYGNDIKKEEINTFFNVSFREFAQKFGTELCRDVLPKLLPGMNFNGRSLWVRTMEGKIHQYKNLVISDCRFRDEADLIKQYKGIIVKVTRNKVENTNNDNKNNSNNENNHSNHSNHSNHASELEMDSITPDFIVENNGTVDDLEKTLLEILKTLNFNL